MKPSGKTATSTIAPVGGDGEVFPVPSLSLALALQLQLQPMDGARGSSSGRAGAPLWRCTDWGCLGW